MRFDFHRVNRELFTTLVVPSLCLVLLTGCRPSASEPPTDQELTNIYTQICASSTDQNVRFFEFTGAKRGTDGVTRTVEGAKVYSVHVTLSYLLKAPTQYRCMGGDNFGFRGPQRCLLFDVEKPGRGTSIGAGDTISCEIPLEFQKVDEGWMPTGFENTYLIKR